MVKNSSSSKKQTRLPVIIIGAGASGLSAAQKLVENKIPVILLEGRDRIGGRLWTSSPVKDVTVDLGGFWVDGCPKPNRIYKMAKEANLDLVPAPYIENPMELFREHRIWDAKKQCWSGWWNINWHMLRAVHLAEKLETPKQPQPWCGGGDAAGLDDPSAAEKKNLQEVLDDVYAKSKVFKPDHYDKFIIETMLKLSNAAPLDTIHPAINDPSYWNIHDEYDQGSEYRVVGGYQKLLDYIRKDIPDANIHLNEIVTSIHQQQGKDNDDDKSKANTASSYCTVTTQDGREYHGSHVVVTVPLGVLKKSNAHKTAIQFDPPLPTSKQEAIERVGVGVLEKLVLTFDAPFWRSDKRRNQNVYYVPAPSGGKQEGSNGFPILVDGTDKVPTLIAMAATPKSQQEVRDGTALPIVLGMLQEMFPNVSKETMTPTSTTTTNWKTDPFSLGSYSTLSTTTRSNDLKILSRPHGLVRFAGEATSYDEAPPGYVESAIVTGWREANRILKELGV